MRVSISASVLRARAEGLEARFTDEDEGEGESEGKGEGKGEA